MQSMHTLAALPGLLAHEADEAARLAHAITVESPSFASGGTIPASYAGRHGRSPLLRWSGVPADAHELVLLCEDPDAPSPEPFVHWIVYGIDAQAAELPEGLPPTAHPLGSGVVQGRNSTGQDGYFGPEPPRGHGVHHYHFQLFALDTRIDPEAPVDRDKLLDAMQGHVLAAGEIVGTFER